MLGSFCNSLNFAAEMEGMNSLGSNVGQEAIARMSPVFGSTITIAPRLALAASAFSAISCRRRSSVVTML
jgi:hypothetical protein